MNITELVVSTKKSIDSLQLDGFFRAVGWRERGKEKWKEALSKSYYLLTVWHDKKIVGLGRIVEDGTMCMLYDIGVHPDYQKRKKGISIGNLIMENLIAHVRDKRYASIGLFAWGKNPDNIPFYKKFGFEQTQGMECIHHMTPE